MVNEVSEGGMSAEMLAKELEAAIEKSSVAQIKGDDASPSQSSLYAGLGALRNLTRGCEKAADAFRHAIAANPQDAMLWNKLGAVLANGFEASEALRACRKAVELSLTFARAWVNAGAAYANARDFARAARYCLKRFLWLTSEGIALRGKSILRMRGNILRQRWWLWIATIWRRCWLSAIRKHSVVKYPFSS